MLVIYITAEGKVRSRNCRRDPLVFADRVERQGAAAVYVQTEKGFTRHDVSPAFVAEAFAA